MTLKRVLGPVDAAWIVSGNMIGAGIFYTPGLVVAYLSGAFWPLVAWLLGGMLALCGAAVYAELGARLPRAGGDYQYLTKAFGPVWGFLSGWAALLLTFSAAAAAMTIVAVGYLRTAAPALADVPTWTVAPVFVLVLTAANVTGARFAGRTTAWFTGIPLVGLLVLFGAGLASGDAEVRWPQTGSLSRPWPLALGAAMLPVFFTYSGWNQHGLPGRHSGRAARRLDQGRSRSRASAARTGGRTHARAADRDRGARLGERDTDGRLADLLRDGDRRPCTARPRSNQ
jgi:APA family basic amino acid/polyamine antiporter